MIAHKQKTLILEQSQSSTAATTKTTSRSIGREPMPFLIGNHTHAPVVETRLPGNRQRRNI